MFVESLAHLAMNMATIMSYAAEISTILTFLVTLPAARAYWRKPDRKRPEHHAHRRAGMPDRRGLQPRPLMYPRSPVTRWPGFPISGPGIGDGRLRDDRPRCADSPGWQIPCAPFRRGGGTAPAG